MMVLTLQVHQVLSEREDHFGRPVPWLGQYFLGHRACHQEKCLETSHRMELVIDFGFPGLLGRIDSDRTLVEADLLVPLDLPEAFRLDLFRSSLVVVRLAYQDHRALPGHLLRGIHLYRWVDSLHDHLLRSHLQPTGWSPENHLTFRVASLVRLVEECCRTDRVVERLG
jgi:hypothetical protein